MTQHEKIIQYVKEHGSITPMEAWSNLRITKLSTRIGEIERNKGIKFDRKEISKKNRDGERVRYMQYWFEGEMDAEQDH